MSQSGTPEERKAAEAARKALRNGPDRVVVDKDGHAMPPSTLPKNTRVKFIYIRDDGWTLGAPEKFKDVAERSWDDQWIGKLTRLARLAGDKWQLTVRSQQGFEYEALVLNGDGSTAVGTEPVEMNWNNVLKPNPKGTSLDEMRKMLEDGVDPELDT